MRLVLLLIFHNKNITASMQFALWDKHMENQGAYYIEVRAGDWGLLNSILTHSVTLG